MQGYEIYGMGLLEKYVISFVDGNGILTQITASVERYPKYPICLAIVVMVSLMGPEEKVARRAA
jgi:hypothetical protein